MSRRVSLMKCFRCESRICSPSQPSRRTKGLQQRRPPDVVQGCWNSAWHMGFLHSAHIVQINRREVTSYCIFAVKLKIVFQLGNNDNFVMVFCGAVIILTEINCLNKHRYAPNVTSSALPNSTVLTDECLYSNPAVPQFLSVLFLRSYGKTETVYLLCCDSLFEVHLVGPWVFLVIDAELSLNSQELQTDEKKKKKRFDFVLAFSKQTPYCCVT